MTRGRARRYLLTKQGYYPQVVADAGYTVFDWSTLNAGTLFQDSAKTTPASANGDVIGCWTDGVSGVDATQVTTANKPGLATASLNGLPTLSFDGSDFLSTGNISISTFAVWVVFQTTALGGLVYEHSPTLATNDGNFLLTTATGAFRVKRSISAVKDSSITIADSTYRIMRTEHNGTYATFNGYANNVLISTTASANDVGTGTATQPLYIGSRGGSSLFFTGNIAQLLIVSPYPTDAQIIANMESYINNQWNGVY